MSMVERVAVVLAGGPADWDQCTGVVKHVCRQQARAAIAAMREPTDHMVRIGEYNLEACKGDACEKAALHTYRTMIDAALEPVDDDVDRRVGEKAK